MGHFGYGNPSTGTLSNRVYAGSTSNVPLVLTANNTEVVRITPTAEVGINTATPTAELEVNGFTKLGTDAPAIKMKKFTGNMPATEGNCFNFAHGLNAAKILDVRVVVEYSAGTFVTGEYEQSVGYQSSVYYTSTNIFVCTKAGNSALIIGDPFKILVTYEE